MSNPARSMRMECDGFWSIGEHRSLAKNFIMGIDPQQILPITDLIGTDATYIRGDQWKDALFAYH